MTMIFIINFTKNNQSKDEFLKILLTPPIGSLNDFLAMKISKLINQESVNDIKLIEDKLRHIMIEFLDSYMVFQRIINL